jgi:hypothetical protein
MLANATNLKGFAIRTRDGELGTVDDFYFDDETWAIRYRTVETGGWLAGRQVLISPISVIDTDWQGRRLTSQSPGSRRPNSSGIRVSLLLGWSLYVGSGILSREA